MIFKNTQNWGWLHISWGWKSRNWLGKFIAGFEAGAWRVTLSFVPFCFIHLAYRLKLLHMGSSKRDFCCHLCFPEGQLIIFALEVMNIRWEHCMISCVGWSNMDFKWRNLKQFFLQSVSMSLIDVKLHVIAPHSPTLKRTWQGCQHELSACRTVAIVLTGWRKQSKSAMFICDESPPLLNLFR